ncbi:MAG: type II toxin-antitoxin system PemK/MazF family toxin [Candidatus Diapherotrites archaeon]|nr:type II toxin-antitoxin system PemK/MazF family toxin [Candidatus Diapherotrites archaeon]
MERFVKGSIVVFPFPYTDLSNTKLRPCLILSDEMAEDILLCQITSKNSVRDQFVVELNKSETDYGSLMIDSFIRTNMLFTANKYQITKTVCKLKKQKYAEVVERIIKMIQ